MQRKQSRDSAATAACTQNGDAMDSYRRGLEALTGMLGMDQAAALIERFRTISPAFEQEVVSVVFGRTWARKGIDLKTRSLCSICILAALGRINALKINYTLALENGASLEEITEVLLQVGVYAGYPAALDALLLLDEIVKKSLPESR
jgi:4-carboxymuconolactone decarboxylase